MSLKIFIVLASILTFVSTERVDLSGRGLKKEEFFLKYQSHFVMADVTELILSRNQFDSFLDCSTNLSSLRTLDLSENHLQRFFFLCKDEYNLQVLNVSNNRLEYVDDDALSGSVPKLKILDLSFNKLSIVNETMLQYLKVLEFLSLANNPISEGIHSNAFWPLTALKHLDLKNISTPYLAIDIFKTLGNLSTLNLSWNPISTLPLLPDSLEKLDISGTEIDQLDEIYLPRLKELQMNRMLNLTSLVLNDLVNLTSLEVLSLIGCTRLAQFTIWPHHGILLPRLQRLSIENCALETLESDLRSIIQRTAVIDLRNNPWKCDCRMQWVNANDFTKKLSREIKCYMPGRHHNKFLQEIQSYDLQCEYISSVFYPILWTCISLLILSAIILGTFFVVRKQGGQWTVRRRNRDTVTYMNVVESSNDLVRILAVSENHERNDE